MKTITEGLGMLLILPVFLATTVLPEWIILAYVFSFPQPWELI